MLCYSRRCFRLLDEGSLMVSDGKSCGDCMQLAQPVQEKNFVPEVRFNWLASGIQFSSSLFISALGYLGITVTVGCGFL